jgi:hypothetical protein
MTPDQITSILHSLIESAFDRLDQWRFKNAVVRSFRPGVDEWNIDQIIEHIALANRYLMMLIDKGAKKALRKAGKTDISKEIADYQLANPRLEQIGIDDSFKWETPGHMRPTCETSLPETLEELHGQKIRLLENLSLLKNGEGILQKTTMTVNSIGKLDVYQYIYFLVMHMRRHIQQMEKIESGYAGHAKNTPY